MTFSPEQIKELSRKLDPKNVQPPPTGKYGSYLYAWHVIEEANRIFGFDGWSYSLTKLSNTNQDQKQDGKWAIGYFATVSVNVGGVVREDVGHGQGFGKSLGDAHDSAVKEAVTDALKRALRTFGNQFGLALYDKKKVNVGIDEPEPKQSPTTPLYNEHEQKWLAKRPAGPRLSEADSATLFSVISTELENCESEADVTSFSADNAKALAELDDSHWVKIVYRAKQISNGKG